MTPNQEDHTPCLRMVLNPSLAKEPPKFIALFTIHREELLQRVFFIGLLGHCLVCGKITPQQRQHVVEMEQQVVEPKQLVLETDLQA